MRNRTGESCFWEKKSESTRETTVCDGHGTRSSEILRRSRATSADDEISATGEARVAQLDRAARAFGTAPFFTIYIFFLLRFTLAPREIYTRAFTRSIRFLSPSPRPRPPRTPAAPCCRYRARDASGRNEIGSPGAQVRQSIEMSAYLPYLHIRPNGGGGGPLGDFNQ